MIAHLLNIIRYRIGATASPQPALVASLPEPLRVSAFGDGQAQRMARPVTRWGLLSRSRNRLDGETTHIIMSGQMPALFHTRAAARKYANEKYGYIKSRPDLRGEPHGWRMPKPVRLAIQARTGG